MGRIAIVLLLTSILMISTFSGAGIGLAYAQNAFDTVSLEAPNPSQPYPLYQPGPTAQSSEHYQAGYILGITIGANIAPIEGINARDSGLELNPTYYYQPPAQEDVCLVYQDASGNACDMSQQQVIDFLQGFTTGYETGYGYGFTSAYVLDEHFPSQAQLVPTPQPAPGGDGIYQNCIALGYSESICEYAAGGDVSGIPGLCANARAGGAPIPGCE
jgi:hypothetical protein